MADKQKQFDHFQGRPQDKTSVWYYFLREKSCGVAKCNKCGKEIKASGGSTSGLHTHLRTSHQINLLKRNAFEATSSSSTAGAVTTSEIKLFESRNKITTYFLKNEDDDTLPHVLAKLTSTDGLPFRVFTTSTELRKSLTARGFEVPKSPETIRQIVMKYATKITISMTRELSELQQKGCRFSLTFDEWTSVKNKRYLNINLHSRNKCWNFGLIRVNGSLPADACIKLISNKLKEYNLKFDRDIVCITTDGASVMKKIGQLIGIRQQLCLAHGIQLAVVDVLYKRRVAETTIVDHLYVENSDDEIIDENDDEDFAGFCILQSSSNSNEVTNNLLPLINKVRNVVKIFKRSPIKNEILQVYVKAAFGKEFTLILDNKTRWNSLLFMLERFYKLKNLIQKSLIDINSPIVFTDSEFELLLQIVSTLLPVKLAVEALCRRDANLLTADVTLTFMLQNLGEGSLSNEMRLSLIHRIKERRTNLSYLVQYLHKGDRATNNLGSDIIFDRFNKTDLVNFIVDLIQRISSITNEDIALTVENNDFEVTITNEDEHLSLTLQERLEMAINDEIKIKSTPKKTNSNNNLAKMIRKEMSIFEAEGTRGTNLQFAYDCLLTIPPTSVESERVFSSSGIICTNIRSSLNDDTLNSLCFLRSYFNINK